MQRQQRDPVAKHIVHLPRDPGALGQSDPVSVQPLRVFGAQGTIAQREKKLTPGPDEHPQAVAANAKGVTSRTTESASVVGL